MFAVMSSGGKQHKVREGDVVKLEKLDQEVGESVLFDHVLMVANGDDIKVGAPYVEGSKVHAEVVEQARDKKVMVLKFKRRQHHMKKQGHRQYFTAVKITKIEG